MPFNNLFIAVPLSPPGTALPSDGQKFKPPARRDVTDHRLLVEDGEISTVQTVTLDTADSGSAPPMAQAGAIASCDFENLSLTDIANGACAPPTSEPAPLQAAVPWFRLTAHADPGLGEPFDAQHARMFAATREVSPDVPMAMWLGGPLLLARLALTGGHAAAGTAVSVLTASPDEQNNVPLAPLLQGGPADDSLLLDDALLARLATSLAAEPTLLLDGGAGVDTVRLAGTQMSLDLTHIADLASRVQSIEKLDLGDAAAHHSVTLDAASVLALGAAGIFNDTTFADGLGAAAGRTQLVVDGGPASVLKLDGAWVESNVTLSRGSATYAVYDSADTLAQLIVNTDLTRDLG